MTHKLHCMFCNALVNLTEQHKPLFWSQLAHFLLMPACMSQLA